ncbi:hypothetical protein ACFLQN_03485 [Candidatus Aenigmatarchaeota archaeon]
MADITFESWFIILEVVLIVLFGVLLMQAIGSFIQPDLQTALINTDLLRANMNEACLLGVGTTVRMDGFKLTQPAPSKAWQIFDLGNSLARFQINSAGDPHYVLYYEAFPYGEGIGWEIYQELDNRILTYFTHRNDDQSTPFSIGVEEFENLIWKSTDANYVKTVKDLLNQRLDENPEFLEDNPEVFERPYHVLVSNIALSKHTGPIPGYVLTDEGDDGDSDNCYDIDGDGESIPVPCSPISQIGLDFGEWNDNFFEFKNYRLLTPLERSFIKYRPCGDNSLCLKTREGVYRFGLAPECKNIKYMQIVYDNREKAWSYVSVIGGALGIALLSRISIPATIFKQGMGATGIGKWLLGKAGNLFLKKIPALLFKKAPAITTVVAGDAIGEAFIWIIGNFVSYKQNDLYFASPCEIESEIEINVKKCEDLEYECEKIINYPIYEYGEETDDVYRAGTHYSCIFNTGEKIIKHEDSLLSGTSGALRGSDCIEMRVKSKPTNFCWTPNPKPASMAADEKFVAGLVDATPISSASAHFEGEGIHGFLIKPLRKLGLLTGVLKDIVDIDWRWPSGFLLPN